MTHQITNHLTVSSEQIIQLPEYKTTAVDSSATTSAVDSPQASPASAPESDVADQPVVGPWFITSCLLLPVVWGVLVHLVFNRLRRKTRPDKLTETGWPDYQI